MTWHDWFSVRDGFPYVMVFRVLLVFYIHWFSAYITPSTTLPPPLRVFGAYIPFFPGALPPHAKWTGPPPLPPFLPHAPSTHTQHLYLLAFSLLSSILSPPYCTVAGHFFGKEGGRDRTGPRVRRGSTAAPESPSVFGPPSRASDGGNVGFGLRSFKGNRSCVHFLCSWPAA